MQIDFNKFQQTLTATLTDDKKFVVTDLSPCLPSVLPPKTNKLIEQLLCQTLCHEQIRFPQTLQMNCECKTTFQHCGLLVHIDRSDHIKEMEKRRQIIVAVGRKFYTQINDVENIYEFMAHYKSLLGFLCAEQSEIFYKEKKISQKGNFPVGNFCSSFVSMFALIFKKLPFKGYLQL